MIQLALIDLAFSLRSRLVQELASYPGARERGQLSAWLILHAHASNVRLFYSKISRLCFDNVVVVIVEHALVIISTRSRNVWHSRAGARDGPISYVPARIIHCQKCNTFFGHHLYSSQNAQTICYKHYNKHNKDIT